MKPFESEVPRPSQPAIEGRPLHLPGVTVLSSRKLGDTRGLFVKVNHRPWFESQGLPVDWEECYWSTSQRGVIRGLHLQAPPVDHAKMVWCIQGEALDVVVDLRSSHFGHSASVILQAGQGIILPRGVAHGFLAREDHTTLLYFVSTVHHPTHDTGVRWDSFGFDWNQDSPILSDRDRSLPPLESWRGVFT